MARKNRCHQDSGDMAGFGVGGGGGGLLGVVGAGAPSTACLGALGLEGGGVVQSASEGLVKWMI